MVFDMVGAGSPPPYRSQTQIGAGLTVELFHRQFYGEPEYYLTSERRSDEVSVLVSFIDGDGRSGDVRASATVER